jgi:hypothetical protein
VVCKLVLQTTTPQEYWMLVEQEVRLAVPTMLWLIKILEETNQSKLISIKKNGRFILPFFISELYFP